MKPVASLFLLCLALVLPPHVSRAQDGVPAPLAAAITQLDTDLLAIPAGSTVTDVQHQGIVADLNALAVGVVPAPAADDIDSAATTLGNAAAAGNVTVDALAELNTDLAADATDADDWTDDITDAADTLLSPDDADPGPVATDPTDPGTDPTDPGTTVAPVFVTATSTHPRRTLSTREFELGTESGQSPSTQFYDGQVEFVTRQVDGAAVENTVYVRAVGLPPSNPYTLAVTRKSDGAIVNVGTFNVKSVSSYEFNLYLTAATPDGYHQKLENITLAKTSFGGGKLKKAVPAGFNAYDVATISLVDAQGVARLSGQADIASRYASSHGVVLHLYGDPVAAPAAFAVAKGNRTVPVGTNFAYTAYFSARHLPANTAVTLVADGVAVGTFTTGAHGRLMITQGFHPPIYTHSGARLYPQTLPKDIDLSQVKALSLTDTQGNVLLSSPTP